MVYIREAHPSDGWQLPVNVRDEVVHETPGSYEQRGGLAQMCVIKLGIELPALVDNFDDSTDIAYTGWPDRLYVIGKDGKIAYKSGPGPFGFDPAAMEEAISGLLPESRQALR